MVRDKFLEIALQRKELKEEKLIKPAPIKYEKLSLPLVPKSTEPVNTKEKMSTKEELLEELANMRQKYAPFMRKFAPKAQNINTKIPIKNFIVDGKEDITIPHYCGPLGNATKVYESEFSIDSFENKAVYICFKGADYIAEVYVNDVCVGMHEGFFAHFEFEITDVAKKGKNKLKVILKNDFVYNSNGRNGHSDSEKFEGDKLYAATGLGYDDPQIGWHHCPPGMGIYDEVYAEVRNRLNIADLFVRPNLCDGSAELWVEIENSDYKIKNVSFEMSLYGQNFEETVSENICYVPSDEGHGNPQHGRNLYKISIPVPNVRVWDIETPYLYNMHVSVKEDGEVTDIGSVTFGMRSFSQDVDTVPKGMFYLNGRKIKLRGANTMGFEQQDVLNGDFEQLIDDILLAKICNMNFLRITQRPVQDEVYEYCSMLGIMTQSDLPLFSCMRRNKVCEGIRQAEEMIRHVRRHACNVVVSYINEPFDKTYPPYRYHRQLTRAELEEFFKACDFVVKLNHPDCVIKHVDGDYTQPDMSGQNCLPDNHTYTLWYNGHEIRFGELYKGYWQKVAPDWYYGCGEFGTEALDFPDLMRRRYPKEWIREPFTPANIIASQSATCHSAFFDTPDTLEDWCKMTQQHQAFATTVMTEAFRRDPRMITFAIHLFIDAWPSGWMKTIMDCERNPKPAYFAYRNALEPIIVSIRSDRFTYYEGEKVSLETYVCNDTANEGTENHKMVFELYDGDKMIMQTESSAMFKAGTTTYVGNAEFEITGVDDRKTYTLKAILTESGKAINYNVFCFEVFKRRKFTKNDDIVFISDLEMGEHEIAGEKVTVMRAEHVCDLTYFASRKTGHPCVAEFKPNDFNMWYSAKEDMIMPIAEKTFIAEGFTPILIFGDAKMGKLFAGVKEYQGRKYVISLIDHRTENPVAERYLENIYKL